MPYGVIYINTDLYKCSKISKNKSADYVSPYAQNEQIKKNKNTVIKKKSVLNVYSVYTPLRSSGRTLSGGGGPGDGRKVPAITTCACKYHCIINAYRLRLDGGPMWCIARAGVRAISCCARYTPDGVFLDTGCLQNKHGTLGWQRFQ